MSRGPPVLVDADAVDEEVEEDATEEEDEAEDEEDARDEDALLVDELADALDEEDARETELELEEELTELAVPPSRIAPSGLVAPASGFKS
jgi:hypothetical protein